jgi:iron complex outermembrane receptor protein
LKWISLLLIGWMCLLPAGVPGARSETGDMAVISGRVLDANTSETIRYCTITIDTLGIQGITDQMGNFVMGGIPPRTVRILITHVSYTPLSKLFTLKAGDNSLGTILLEPMVLQVDPIVVTAARQEQTVKMAPASIVVVGSKEIDDRQVTTFDQVLENVPGVYAFRSTPISVQSLSIRGSSDVAGGGVGNRVLLLVDGRPALTSDSGGAFWSLVPTNFIDRVEIVKGAFSSLYGSTAMGGVVNVITQRPHAASSTRLDLKIGFFEKAPPAIRYTENTPMQNEVQLDHSGERGKVGYLFNASRKQSDGHADGTRYEFYNLYFKTLYDISPARHIELALGGGYADNDYPHAWLSSAQPLKLRAKYTDDRQEKKYFSADLHYWAVFDSRLKYSTRFYYDRQDRVSFFNQNDAEQNIPGNEPFGTETNIDGEKIGAIAQFDWYLQTNRNVIAGIDVQVDNVESSPDSVLYGDRQINNFAVFVQGDVEINSGLSATVGGRYDWNHLVAGKTLEQFSPKLGLVWSPASRVSVRALYGRAFRAPTIAERFLREEVGGGVNFVPNPDLKAERMDLSAEVGARWKPWDWLDIDVAAFRYEYEDLIYWQNISDEMGVDFPLYQVRNLNSALMEGIELSLGCTWSDHLNISSNYTHLNAKDQSPDRTDDVLAYRPEHTFRLSTAASWKQIALQFESQYRSKIEEVFLFPLQAPEEYWVSSIAGRYRLNNHLTFTLKVSNIFDKQYEELARYRMPGRSWIFGASLAF